MCTAAYLPGCMATSQAMPEHEFVLWVIGAHAADRGKFVYELPGNVVEVHEVFLDDALRLSGEQHEASFNDREREALRRLVSLSNPDWDVLFDIFYRRRVHPLSFLQSRTFMDIFRDVCLAEYPYTPFADAFHTMRSMLLPVLYLLGSEVPVADVYHAISTGYGGSARLPGLKRSPGAGAADRAWHLYPRTRGRDHSRRLGGAVI